MSRGLCDEKYDSHLNLTVTWVGACVLLSRGSAEVWHSSELSVTSSPFLIVPPRFHIFFLPTIFWLVRPPFTGTTLWEGKFVRLDPRVDTEIRIFEGTGAPSVLLARHQEGKEYTIEHQAHF